MIVGYARVSKEDQDLGRQIKALNDAGCGRVYEEKISGAKAQRPQLDLLLSELQSGDIVVVQKLDRLGRSLRHLIELVTTFKEKGVGFKSLTDAIDTTTPQGVLIFHIMGAIAQFERELIRERTKDAMAYHKSQGEHMGRPYKDNLNDRRELKACIAQGLKRAEVMAKLGITHYRYHALKREIKELGTA